MNAPRADPKTQTMGRVLSFLLLCACATVSPRAAKAPGSFAARVISAELPDADHSFVVAVVQLTNPSEHAVTVDRFVVEWPGGSAASDRDRFVVPPGATVWRRIDTRSYDPNAIAGGHVTVETDTAVTTSVLR